MRSVLGEEHKLPMDGIYASSWDPIVKDIRQLKINFTPSIKFHSINIHVTDFITAVFGYHGMVQVGSVFHCHINRANKLFMQL